MRGVASASETMALSTPGVPPNEASPPTPSEEGIRLVYIVGAPRSGSTITGLLAGAHERAFFTGELHRFPPVPSDRERRCACGRKAVDCPFWTAVEADFTREVDVAAFHRGQERFEQWRSYPRVAVDGVTDSHGLDEHGHRLAILLKAIARHSGKRVIVDSCKNAVRGRILERLASEGISVYFVHVVRDGRGFMWSEMRRPGGIDGAPRTIRETGPILALRWVGSNVLSYALCSGRDHRYLRIRYEDLASAPRQVLGRLGKFLGLDYSEVIRRVEAQEEFPAGHAVGGNRLRFGSTRISGVDKAWRYQLPLTGRFAFWALAGWLALVYGYPVRQRGNLSGQPRHRYAPGSPIDSPESRAPQARN
jgi:hypothetical protein